MQQDDVEVLSGGTIQRLPGHFRGGVYLLQSATDPRYYRIGESKNLVSRQGTHRGSAPKTRWQKAPNWTEVFRPWQFIWVANFPSASDLGLKMCEHHLHAVFAKQFDFVDESGFEAPADAAADLAKIANNELSELMEIAARQRRDKFDKEAHWQTTWQD